MTVYTGVNRLLEPPHVKETTVGTLYPNQTRSLIRQSSAFTQKV